MLLQDKDRIFRNLYGFHDWKLAGARVLLGRVERMFEPLKIWGKRWRNSSKHRAVLAVFALAAHRLGAHGGCIRPLPKHGLFGTEGHRASVY